MIFNINNGTSTPNLIVGSRTWNQCSVTTFFFFKSLELSTLVMLCYVHNTRKDVEATEEFTQSCFVLNAKGYVLRKFLMKIIFICWSMTNVQHIKQNKNNQSQSFFFLFKLCRKSKMNSFVFVFTQVFTIGKGSLVSHHSNTEQLPFLVLSTHAFYEPTRVLHNYTYI